VSFRFLLTPKWIAWTLFVVMAVAVMANLSVWQLGRLNDRRATNAAIEQRSTEPVVAVDDPALAGLSVDDLRYRTLTATGTYLTDDEVLVANQTLGAAPGWWVVTPLRTPSGAVVLVNRGWVPFSTVTPDGSFAAFAPPSGEVSVSGLAQSGQTRVEGLADDARALPRLDVVLLADRLAAQGITDVAPYWLQLNTQQPPQPGSEPIALVLPPLDDGPHLNYTGQWAIFASLTAIVFLVLVVRTAQRGGDGAGSARRAGEARSTDLGLLVQLGVRLAPLVPRQRLAAVVRLPDAEVAERLAELEGAGLVRFRVPEPSGWSLTPDGNRELTARLAAELDAAGLRPAMQAAYQRFLGMNADVLAVCTDWQVRVAADGTLVVNDHNDAAYDAAVVARMAELDDRAGPVCDDLAAVLSRFANYRHRLGEARRRVESGDTQWIDRPLIDSFHTVWFELHEHLLATLGIERGQQPSAVGTVGTSGEASAAGARSTMHKEE
jgi:cytochrome oxidase assembly protein ShyY1